MTMSKSVMRRMLMQRGTDSIEQISDEMMSALQLQDMAGKASHCVVVVCARCAEYILSFGRDIKAAEKSAKSRGWMRPLRQIGWMCPECLNTIGDITITDRKTEK